MIARRELLAAGVAAFAAPALGACGHTAATGPPTIHYGRDVCAECHMIISEARFAAALRDRSGTPFVFDDIGDMVAFAKRTGGVDQVTAWVHDSDSKRWISAPDAAYVRDSGVVSPMAHNLVAFTTLEGANAYLDERGGYLITWKDLIADASKDAVVSQATDHSSHP